MAGFEVRGSTASRKFMSAGKITNSALVHASSSFPFLSCLAHPHTALRKENGEFERIAYLKNVRYYWLIQLLHDKLK